MGDEEDKIEGYERVCSVDEVPEHLPMRVEVAGRGVLLCKEGGQIHAVDEICPHKNKSMRMGVVFAGEIICPHHQYHFDLTTGRCKKRCAPVHIYQVKVADDGQVWIRA